MNETIKTFGYPNSLIKEFDHWVIMIRPAQVTIGSVVLACKEESESLGDTSPEAYAELSLITKELENTLRNTFGMKKINYLALMMVDKNVHFHVIPRYSEDIEFNNVTFKDFGWPKLPEMGKFNNSETEMLEKIKNHLIENWNK